MLAVVFDSVSDIGTVSKTKYSYKKFLLEAGSGVSGMPHRNQGQKPSHVSCDVTVSKDMIKTNDYMSRKCPNTKKLFI